MAKADTFEMDIEAPGDPVVSLIAQVNRWREYYGQPLFALKREALNHEVAAYALAIMMKRYAVLTAQSLDFSQLIHPKDGLRIGRGDADLTDQVEGLFQAAGLIEQDDVRLQVANLRQGIGGAGYGADQTQIGTRLEYTPQALDDDRLCFADVNGERAHARFPASVPSAGI